MAKVLLFNVTRPETRKELQILSVRQNFSIIDVPKEKQGSTIRELLSGMAVSKRIDLSFSDEMMVMNGFDHAGLDLLLNEMNRSGTTIRLKAVVTETNQHWSALQLHGTLLAESMAMSARGKGVTQTGPHTAGDKNPSDP
ncbi:MAG: DUF3783 domain-containing protein [Clostridia bacterium]|nr:DUF3783 domain-containing protein [Clostridia bacterium]